jgi:hypothetical protein
MWIKVRECLIVAQSAIRYGTGCKKAVFPSVSSGNFEQLHPYLFMEWEENFTQVFDLPF